MENSHFSSSFPWTEIVLLSALIHRILFIANIIDLHWPLKTYTWILCVCSAFRKLHGLYGLPDEVPTCLRWRLPLRQGGVSDEREQGESWLKRCSLSFLCFQKPVDQCCAGRLGEYHTRLNDRLFKISRRLHLEKLWFKNELPSLLRILRPGR